MRRPHVSIVPHTRFEPSLYPSNTPLPSPSIVSLMRRPHVSIAEDVGGWAALMDMMSILGQPVI